MKNWLIGALVVALVTATVPSTSEARRLGGGKSTGLQRDMPARTAPTAAPAQPAAPQPAKPGQQAAPATAGAAPAAAPKRSWMGPLAGLAAGLGIAALMSHLGMGEAMGNFIMMALLGVAAVALVMFLMRRFGPNRNAAAPAMAGAPAAGAGAGAAQVAWPQPAQGMERTALDDGGAAGASAGPADPGSSAPEPAAAAVAGAAVAAGAPVARAFVPAAFDSEGFARTAKLIFIRLQAANDSADLDDLRRFTTPELFASLRLDLQERGASGQQTDVVKVEADVLDVTQEADRQVVSVRFHGEMVEEKGAAPAAFSEVWHLVKPHDDSRTWAIAGIEQAP